MIKKWMLVPETGRLTAAAGRTVSAVVVVVAENLGLPAERAEVAECRHRAGVALGAGVDFSGITFGRNFTGKTVSVSNLIM
jgi:hypothetical protein